MVCCRPLCAQSPADSTSVIGLVHEAMETNRFLLPRRDSLLRVAAVRSVEINRYDYALRIYHLLSFLKQQQSEFKLAKYYALQAMRMGEQLPVTHPSYRDAIANLAMCYHYAHQPDSCLYWVEAGLKRSRGVDDFNTSVLLMMKAFTYDMPENISTMIAFIDSAQAIALRTPSLHDDVFASFNKVTYLQLSGKNGWGESLELLTSFQDKVDDPSLRQRPVEPYQRTPFFYRNAKNTLNMMLAITYLNLGDLDDACYYMQVTVDNYRADKNPYLSYVLCDLAAMESFRGNEGRAHMLYDSAMNLIQERTRTNSISYPSFHYMTGWIAERNGNYPQAIQSYTHSANIADFYFPPAAVPALLRVLVKSRQLNRADSLVRALRGSDYMYNTFFRIPFLKEVSSYYLAKGNESLATTALLRHYQLKDSVQAAARYYAVKEVETRFKTREREKELALSRSEQAAQQQELIQKKRETVYLTGGMVVLVFLIIALYSTYQTKKKQAQVLAQKNHQIEVLIKELHHRVKNNMQTISSLLGLQSYRVTDEQARSALREGQTRVEAMALIHQKLYLDTDLRAVDMEQYLTALIATLAQSYGYDPGVVKSDIALEDKNLDVDVAIPLGLIINELIINSFKYAFEEVLKPELRVSLRRNEASQLELLIRDNGKGLPEGAQDRNTGSFGLRLVQTLTRQLNATLQARNEHGAVFQIVFTGKT